jgi:hypothetical protein
LSGFLVPAEQDKEETASVCFIFPKKNIQEQYKARWGTVSAALVAPRRMEGAAAGEGLRLRIPHLRRRPQ